MRVTFRAASQEDELVLLPMIRALWEHEGVPFDEAANRVALGALFADAALGRVWLAIAEGSVAGYAMGTWGFSTEQGGRFLLLDELFVLPAHRGKGVARATLAFVEEEAGRSGAGAVRLEVAEGNDAARELYRKAGYADPGRRFLARRLAPPSGPRRRRPERVEARILVRSDPARVWEALATGEGLDAWFTTGARLEARPGGLLSCRWERWGPDEFTGTFDGEVLEAVPPRRLVFRWAVDTRTCDTVVEFDLAPRGDATVVDLVEHGFEEGPAGLREMLRHSAGWGEALALLKLFLERGARV